MSYQGVPILMYHSLTEKELPSLNEVHIPVNQFKEQMAWLASEGYSTVTFHEVVAANKKGTSLPFKSVVLTFDDGYHSLYQHAQPLLSHLHYSATLFLTTSQVNKENYKGLDNFSETSFPLHDRPLKWEELSAMSKAGWAIEAHGHTHPNLSALSKEAVREEITQCNRLIAQHLGSLTRYFAYPFGKYNRHTLQVVKEVYEGACTVHPGKSQKNEDVFRLHRIEINKYDTLDSFQRKVETGYVNQKEESKSRFRNFLYRSPFVKDVLQSF